MRKQDKAYILYDSFYTDARLREMEERGWRPWMAGRRREYLEDRDYEFIARTRPLSDAILPGCANDAEICHVFEKRDNTKQCK